MLRADKQLAAKDKQLADAEIEELTNQANGLNMQAGPQITKRLNKLSVAPAAQAPAQEPPQFLGSRWWLPCSRDMRCKDPRTCQRLPILPDASFAKSVHHRNVLFLGDSVSAQMECDLRGRIRRTVGASNVRGLSGSSADFPTINASVRYIGIGCPWFCTNQSHEVVPTYFQQHVSSATHIVFNIGAHYEGKHQQLLDKHLQLFAGLLIRSSARLIVRSQSHTHFPTKDGLFQHRGNGSGDGTYCMAHPAPPTQLHVTEVALRNFAARMHAGYLDVLGLSDDANAHPIFHATNMTHDRVMKDCRHFCQDCDSFGAWNSLLVASI